MRCPNCQAKLLPVDGELFCLQCGMAVRTQPAQSEAGPVTEETTDPLLQRAITDAVGHKVEFRLPVSGGGPPPEAKSRTFMSAGSLLPRPAMAGVNMSTGVLAAPVGLDPLRRVPTSLSFESPAWARNSTLKRVSPWLLWGLAAVVLFGLLNVIVAGVFSGRVYPGVKVGRVEVGGVQFGALPQALGQSKPVTQVSVLLGPARYSVAAANVASANVAVAQRQAEQVGRNVPLPLFGLLQAWVSSPVAMTYQVNRGGLAATVDQLAAQVDHTPSSAVPLIVNGQAFVITEKAGNEIDESKAAAQIRQALQIGNLAIALTTDSVAPVVAYADYANDLAAAEERLALNLKVVVKNATYNLTPAQIGGWLAFSGPGKGVAVNQAAVAAYVATIPGKFDRVGAMNALISAVHSGSNLNYAASTKLITATPKPAGSAAQALIGQAYQYCIQAGSSGERAQLGAGVSSALSGANGWGVGGRLAFAQAMAGCNMTVELADAVTMGQFDQSCSSQTSCQVGNQLIINTAAWNRAPSGWSGSLADYRSELINNNVGDWLGFEHGPCTGKTAPAPILQAPTLVLNGCSPNWYEVQPSLQNEKVLPGFR